MRPSALPRARHRVLAAIAIAAAVVAPPAAAGAQLEPDVPAGQWIPPVAGSVVRPFAEPPGAYAAGHRGVDFAAAPGTAVRASNDGVVSFAGSVAGALHVVVAHGSGIRTSYSFLTNVDVRTGQQVQGGQVIGRAGGSGDGHGPGVLHFGVRIGERYVDPMLLFRPRDLTEMVRLIPTDELARAADPDPRVDQRDLAAVVDEHDRDCAGFVGDVADFFGLGSVADSACDALDSLVDDAWRGMIAVSDEIADLVDRIEPVVSAVIDRMAQLGEDVAAAAAAVADSVAQAVVDVVEAVVEYGKELYEELTSCPQPAPSKHPKGSGNLVMTIGGLGSSRRQRPDGSLTRGAKIDTLRLGYGASEVSCFSYRAGSPVYAAPDTTGDLHEAARELGRQLQAIGRQQPGRRVDLIAHSQGGVVVDLFLTEVYLGNEHEYPAVANVVTFASPHEGTPLANLQQTVIEHPLGKRFAQGFTTAPLGGASLEQLQEGSPTIEGLQDAPRPRGVRFLSIAGSEDPAVPSSSADPPFGEKVVVQAGDAFVPDDHGAILRDGDALSAAQAHLVGGRPANSCGILVDAPGEALSTAVRAATEAVEAMGALPPQPFEAPGPGAS
jgi:hypothetical protein